MEKDSEEKEKEKGKEQDISMPKIDMEKVKGEVSKEILTSPIRIEINRNFNDMLKMLTNLYEFLRENYLKVYIFTIPFKKFQKTLLKINVEMMKLEKAGIENFRSFTIPKISAVIMELYKPISLKEDIKKDLVEIEIEKEDREKKKEILKYMQRAECEDTMEKEHYGELEKCDNIEEREKMLQKFVNESFMEQERSIDSIGEESKSSKIFKKRYIPSVETFDKFMTGIKTIMDKGESITLIPEIPLDFGDIYRKETKENGKFSEEGIKRMKHIYTCYRIFYKICEKNKKLHEEHREETLKRAQAKIVELLMGEEQSKSSGVFSDIIGTAITQSKKKVEEMQTFGMEDGMLTQGTVVKSVVDELQTKIKSGKYREKELRKIGDKLLKGKSKADIAKQFAGKNMHEIMASLQKSMK